MDSFELNKVLGAVLGTCLALLSLNIAAGALFTPPHQEKPGYEIAVQEQTAAKPGAQAPAEEPLGLRLASADIKRGEASTKKCQACHTFAKGEPNRVGPNLYGVVGRKKDAAPGFNYSAAMKKQEGTWTPQDLDHFLTNPRAAIPGTAMTFAGLPRGKERADVIAFLNHNSDHPEDLAKLVPATPPAKAAGAAAGGDKPQDAKPAASGAAKAEAPKAEAPKAEAPKADAPKTEAPKTEAPKADAPKADAPKADAPKADAPKADAPKPQ
jgi:cytochrome c